MALVPIAGVIVDGVIVGEVADKPVVKIEVLWFMMAGAATVAHSVASKRNDKSTGMGSRKTRSAFTAHLLS